jgi:hypothetical protein
MQRMVLWRRLAGGAVAFAAAASGMLGATAPAQAQQADNARAAFLDVCDATHVLPQACGAPGATSITVRLAALAGHRLAAVGSSPATTYLPRPAGTGAGRSASAAASRSQAARRSGSGRWP